MTRRLVSAAIYALGVAFFVLAMPALYLCVGCVRLAWAIRGKKES